MPTALWMADGGDSTHGLHLWDTVTGTVSSESPGVDVGRHYALSPASTLKKLSIMPRVHRLSWLMSVDAHPTFSFSLVLMQCGSGNTSYALYLNPNGTLKLSTARTGSLFFDVNGTTALSVDTLYRISVGCRWAAVNDFDLRVYINGALEFNVSQTDTENFELAATGTLQCFGTSPTIYAVDSIYLDDGADASDIGDVHVTNKRPDAANTSNFDTPFGSGTNREDRVREQPLSESAGYRHNAATDVVEDYTLEDAATGDVDLTGATILGHQAWGWAARGATRSGIGAPASTANNTGKGNPAATTLTISLGTVAAGDLVVVAFADLVGSTAPTIDDSIGGNTWNALSGPTTNTVRLSKWYCLVTNAGTMTITVTFASSNVARAGVAGRWLAENIAASPLDKNVTNANDSTSPYDCPTTGTLAQAIELVLGFVALNGPDGDNFAASSPDAVVAEVGTTGGSATSNATVGMIYRATVATTAVAPQATNNNNRAGVVGTASFEALGAVSAGDPKLIDDGTETSIVLSETPALYTRTT